MQNTFVDKSEQPIFSVHYIYKLGQKPITHYILVNIEKEKRKALYRRINRRLHGGS